MRLRSRRAGRELGTQAWIDAKPPTTGRSRVEAHPSAGPAHQAALKQVGGGRKARRPTAQAFYFAAFMQTVAVPRASRERPRG
jgi:hypothetical protein